MGNEERTESKVAGSELKEEVGKEESKDAMMDQNKDQTVVRVLLVKKSK